MQILCLENKQNRTSQFGPLVPVAQSQPYFVVPSRGSFTSSQRAPLLHLHTSRSHAYPLLMVPTGHISLPWDDGGDAGSLDGGTFTSSHTHLSRETAVACNRGTQHCGNSE